MFIISAPASTAIIITFATNPIKAPTTKFKIISNIKSNFGGIVTVGIIIPLKIPVNIITKDIFTITGISFLDKTGA